MKTAHFKKPRASVFNMALLYKRCLPYLLSTPACLLMLTFLIGPVFGVFFLSFTDWQLGEANISLVGLDNFRAIFKDDVFLRSVRNTALYILMTVPTTLLFGIFFAILIYGAGRLRAIYQTVYFMPFMATAVAMLIVWEFVLNPTVGVWKAVADLSGVSPINLLRNEATALPILAMISIWQNLGFAVVLFLAGLSGIPGEMYEAAELDGADDAFSRFRRITWPMVGHVTFFVVVMLTVRSFQVFESVAVLTQGGPNDATEVLTYTMYKEGFDFFRTNIASAITVVFLLVIGTLMILKATWLEKKVHYS